MEKSIESIWKEGFNEKSSFKAPKIKDLYNRKSMHLIDTFERRFKINLFVVGFGALFLLIVSYLVGIPFMGIGFMLIAVNIMVINHRHSRHLYAIDKTTDSYTYLKSFDTWLRSMIGLNVKMASIYYPLFILSIFLGFWFKVEEGKSLGQIFTEALLKAFPDHFLLLGIPLVVIGILLLVLSGFYVFGGKIYLWDLSIFYKRLLVRLETMLLDMEELK